MKLKLVAAPIITSFTCALSISGAFAETTDNTSAISKGSVNFQADDTGTTPPTDPSSPGDPTEPGDIGDASPSTGALRIDYVSPFNFGDVKISGVSQSYPAKKVKLTNPTTSAVKYVRNYIQVTDARGEKEPQGWEIQASASPFVTDDQDKTELAGAEMRIANVTVNNRPDVASENSPTGVSSEIKLTNQPVTVLSAAKNKGEGLWTANFGGAPDAETPEDNVVPDNPGVKIYVPGGSKKTATKYKSSIKWTVTTGP